MKYTKITIGVVNSRQNDDFEFCKHSIDRQIYLPDCLEYIEINNLKKEKTIGKCFNEIVGKAKHDWILFVGDDDFLARPYLFNLSVFLDNYIEKTGKSPIAVITNLILYSNEKTISLDAAPTGMWKKTYLLKNPFNEKLLKYVDTDLIARANEQKAVIIYDKTNAGYYYRQHNSNVSGNKFKSKTKMLHEIKKRLENNQKYTDFYDEKFGEYLNG